MIRFRELVVLGLILLVGHAALIWGRETAIDGFPRAYGAIAVDRDGNLRHLRRSRDSVALLEHDTVAPGSQFDMPWGEVMPGCRVYPKRVRTPTGFERTFWVDSASRLYDVTMGNVAAGLGTHRWFVQDGLWQANDRSNRMQRVTFSLTGYREGREGAEPLDAATLVALPFRSRTLIGVFIDTRSNELIRLTRTKGAINPRDVRILRTPVEPLPDDRTIRYLAKGDDGFSAVVGNECWSFDLDGALLRRELPGFDFARSARGSHRGQELDGTRQIAAYFAAGAPARPDRPALRVAFIDPGRGVRVQEFQFHATTIAQRTQAALFGLQSLLRPFALNLVAYKTAAPTNSVQVKFRWWLDPFFAEGANRPWLIFSFLVTAACAFVAARQARRRCATRTARLFWVVAAALLGPCGLVWMRLTIPWVAIEEGRAVNMETQPWSQPSPTGIEVFA